MGSSSTSDTDGTDGTDRPRRQTGPARYLIVVAGSLDARWSAWFDGMAVYSAADAAGRPRTHLEGPVADQGAQHGLLSKVRDLNLTLIGVHRSEDSGAGCDAPTQDTP